MKRFMAFLLATLLSVGLLVTPALAAEVSDVELLTEPKTLTYQVGDAYQAKEISFRVTYSDGTVRDVTHESLSFTANGNPVKQGYAFKEPGEKKVIVTYGDYEYKYNLTVKAKGGKTLKALALDTKKPAATKYKLGQAFRADELTLICTYTDGTTERISGTKARISANGNPIQDGYEFIQVGPKSMVVQYGNYKATYQLNVVPNLQGTVKDAELLTEPKTFKYRVGDPFQAEELSVRCYYTDGTYEDFGHRSLEVYASGGTQLISGYKFKEAGKKTITVGFLDYKTDFTITVTN